MIFTKGGAYMSKSEIANLIEWLKEKGHTDEEIVNAIVYIATHKPSSK